MPDIRDDKAPHVVPFILEHLEAHRSRNSNKPFFIGLNGVQGAGKTVLVSILESTLQSPPYSLPTCVFSLDDLYLTHSDQEALAQSHPDNPLLQHRGQPSTHDIPLALSVFESLKACKPTKIPQYNKAAFDGQGDRVPNSEWRTVNDSPSTPIQVIIFEGWSVGFRPVSAATLEQKWTSARDQLHDPNTTYHGRLAHNTLESLTTINNALYNYDSLTDQLDLFIHIDAHDPLYVYKWRLEQEYNLRAKGKGAMSDEEVKNFVDGYYPSYEVYTETLREGVFKTQGEAGRGRQMRLVVGEDRKVRDVSVV